MNQGSTFPYRERKCCWTLLPPVFPPLCHAWSLALSWSFTPPLSLLPWPSRLSFVCARACVYGPMWDVSVWVWVSVCSTLERVSICYALCVLGIWVWLCMVSFSFKVCLIECCFSFLCLCVLCWFSWWGVWDLVGVWVASTVAEALSTGESITSGGIYPP